MWTSEQTSKTSCELEPLVSFVMSTIGYFNSSFSRLRQPCREADGPCEGPYSYRHFLSLTNDSTAFSVSEGQLVRVYYAV